jgi:hypothetical protein
MSHEWFELVMWVAIGLGVICAIILIFFIFIFHGIRQEDKDVRARVRAGRGDARNGAERHDR